jgi:hypothetical protein
VTVRLTFSVHTSESHSTWGDVEKGSHDNAGIGNAVRPFALRQSIDAIGQEPVVRPDVLRRTASPENITTSKLQTCPLSFNR